MSNVVFKKLIFRRKSHISCPQSGSTFPDTLVVVFWFSKELDLDCRTEKDALFRYEKGNVTTCVAG